jgi:hypothetical protein
MERSAGSTSKGARETSGAASTVRPDDRPAGTRLLKVGFGLYLETRETAAGPGLSTAGHPIFEYLFPRAGGDN